MPTAQRNESAGMTLLAMLALRPGDRWSDASAPLLRTLEIMSFVAEHYRTPWAANTRETVRRNALHQFVEAGLLTPNPDDPERPANSPKFRYQATPDLVALAKEFGSRAWSSALAAHLASFPALAAKYAQSRTLLRIPLRLSDGRLVALTPGGQNPIIRAVVEEFCPRFVPGARPILVGDTGDKFAFFDPGLLGELGIVLHADGKMPDVMVLDEVRDWLILVEAVSSHGPINPKRLHELRHLFGASRAGLVFVTAFPDRTTATPYLSEIAWETEVWVADHPDHMIHFNGERFLGPYPDAS